MGPLRQNPIQTNTDKLWQFGTAATALGAETKLHHIGPRWLPSGRQTTSVCNQPPRPTQPPTLSGMGNEYRPKCGDALWMGSKGRYGRLSPLVIWMCEWKKKRNRCNQPLNCKNTINRIRLCVADSISGVNIHLCADYIIPASVKCKQSWNETISIFQTLKQNCLSRCSAVHYWHS